MLSRGGSSTVTLCGEGRWVTFCDRGEGGGKTSGKTLNDYGMTPYIARTLDCESGIYNFYSPIYMVAEIRKTTEKERKKPCYCTND